MTAMSAATDSLFCVCVHLGVEHRPDGRCAVAGCKCRQFREEPRPVVML